MTDKELAVALKEKLPKVEHSFIMEIVGMVKEETSRVYMVGYNKGYDDHAAEVKENISSS